MLQIEGRNSYLCACFVCSCDWVLEGEESVLQRSSYKIGREVSMQCEVLVSTENKIKHYASFY